MYVVHIGKLLSAIFMLLNQALPCISQTRQIVNVYNGYSENGRDPLRLAFPLSGRKTIARWLVIGGRQVVPGSIYRVAVESLQHGIPGKVRPLNFRASLLHNERQVTFNKATVQPGDLSEILLQVPYSSINGTWKLHVEGKEAESQLTIFKNSTLLIFTPQFLTILIQTSRPVYNAGQTVRFRAVMLNRDFKSYEEPVDVFVLDPENRVMRRWPSRQTGDGVINLHFDLPKFPSLGNWTIQIRARQQIQNQKILVEYYNRPRFEVFVRLSPTFRLTEDNINGVVVANMTNWRYVYGNCSIKLQIAMNDETPIPTKYQTIHEYFFYNFTGVQPFEFPMEIMTNLSSNVNNVIIRVLATVGDSFGWQIQHGWALARIIEEEIKIAFLGDQPMFFRPGMPITVHVFVSYTDDHAISAEDMKNSTLRVEFRAPQRTVFIDVNETSLIENEGFAEASFEVPSNAERVEIIARFIDFSGLSKVASMIALKHHSPRDRHLQIETSTFEAVPGEFIVLHVRNNFYITHFNYVIVSNGVIVYSGREPVHDVSVPTVTTFIIPASTDMAPVAKFLVWVVDTYGEVISHSILVPVNPLTFHKVDVRWNEHKDHTGGSAEVKMLGEKGSLFAATGVWEETFLMDSGHDFNEARIIYHMLGYHENRIKPHQDHTNFNIRMMSTRSRYGEGAEIRLFATSNTGPDAPTTFNFSDVVILTDAAIFYHPSKASDTPQCDSLQFQCLTGGCYEVNQRCDGERNCPDSSDEAGCFRNIDPHRNFRIHRISRQHRFYDPEFGDWGWQDIRREGREILVFAFPKRPQNWVFSMFAVGKEKGFGIMKRKIQFDSAGPFVMFVEGPPVARMWEQVGLTVSIFNFHLYEVAVLVTLPNSPDYKSVLVEENGIVNSYEPRTDAGSRQHIVWLPPSSSKDVHMPIVFTRIGTVEVTVRGATQMQKDSHTISINVIPEGATIAKHTSLLLDLKNRALVYEFLNIHLDESPIIPYSLERRYIFGTPQGHISITGDVVGPAFPSIPVGAESLLGSTAMGAEVSAYNFAANLWSLHYLRLTNQITDEITYKVLNAANVEYASLSRYQSEAGGFSNWIGSETSVWLTAHALKNLWVASFQDWENLIYIDNNIIRKGIKWLLDYQTELGSFTETPYYTNPLDYKMDPRSRHDWMPKYQNVSLTAYVVITFCDVMNGIQGALHKTAVLANQRAVSYLERILETLDDPYDLALVSWALIKANSKEKDLAFSKLNAMKRVAGNRIYWSREPVGFNTLVYENSQRPYLQPKDDNKWDAHAVESTAYALLVFVKSEGIGIIQENIVRFLASMRELDGGLISTLDSLVAMEALVQYSYRARLRDITAMKVSIEHSATPDRKMEVEIDHLNDISKMRPFDLEHIFGHLSIIGRGSGQALLQLDYTFGVDRVAGLDIPPVDAFDFRLQAQFNGRNNSHIIIRSCQRWINVNETPTSGVTVVDIHLPSGYYIMQDELNEMVDSRKIKNLRWALRTETQVKFFFNRLDSQTLCFNYTLERWYPVSNHSRHNLAVVYELYQPERFKQFLFEVYPLYALDICEVCGSFQCPYCPYYSESTSINSTYSLLLLCLPIWMIFTKNRTIYFLIS